MLRKGQRRWALGIHPCPVWLLSLSDVHLSTCQHPTRAASPRARPALRHRHRHNPQVARSTVTPVLSKEKEASDTLRAGWRTLRQPHAVAAVSRSTSPPMLASPARVLNSLSPCPRLCPGCCA